MNTGRDPGAAGLDRDAAAPGMLPADQDRRTPLSWLLPLLVLLLCLGLTAAAWHQARQAVARTVQQDFDYQVRRIQTLLQQRMATYEQVLRGAQGFVGSQAMVGRDDFARYVATLRLEESFPGIQGIAIAELIPPDRREAHMAQVRAQGVAAYAVRPEGERNVYSAIAQIEPATAMNLRALGYDMLTEPVRRDAMERSRDSGMAALTGKLRLVQEQEPHVQPGIIVYLPVYGRDLPLDTVEQRRGALRAWVGAPFRMHDLMQGLLGERARDVRLRIFDGVDLAEDARLYDSEDDAPLGPARLQALRQVRIADRDWTLVIGSTPAFEARFDAGGPLLAAGAGAGISVLLAALVWLLASGRQRALALAGDMTAALRASQLRWRYALEGAGDGVWDWNNHSGEVVLSRRWKEMLGYAEAEVEDSFAGWADLLHPQDRERAVQALLDYVAGAAPDYAQEIRMRCRDGSWKWLLTRGMVVSRDAEGRPLRTIGTHTDIDRLKQNEEALRAAYGATAAEQRRIRVILENSYDAFVAVGPDERITDWNAQAERIFGWSAGEAIGQSLASLIIPKAQRAEHLAGFARFIASGGVGGGRREIMALHRSGRQIPVELALAAMPAEGGGHAVTAFVRDISDRREAERLRAEHERSLEEARAALHHAQKLEAVGKLTGGIAHDFNNVLQIISGYLQLMQRGAGGLLARQIDSALDAVDRGARLASGLLTFARRQPLQPVAVDPGRLVRGMEELLRGALGESATLAIRAEDALWNTLVDRDQLQNVILNLAINARDAMDGVGSVEIALDNLRLAPGGLRSRPDLPPGDYVVLAMKDSGAGITPEVRERAFEPFFTTKAEGAGTGLGLAMAYGFATQSGGHIDIDGAPGAGTTVRLFLPRTTEAESAAPGAAGPALQGGDEQVLVVEDDDAVRASVCAMLAELGYRVRSAGDAQAALDMLRQGVPADLVFTDVVMPGPLRAPDMVRQALALRPGLAVLYASGHTRGAVLQGVDGAEPLLLRKPYRREQLAHAVRQALAQARPALQAGRAGQRVVVAEQQEDSRQLACDMLSLLGHAAQGVDSVEAARAALAAAGADVLLVADDVADADAEQLRAIAAAWPAVRMIIVGTAPDGVPATPIDKPYRMETLRAAVDRAG